MNSVNLTGRITADLELKKTKSNLSVCDFSIAVDRNKKGADGEKIVDFFNLQVWNQGAEFLCKYAGKGAKVGITGRLVQDRYVDNNGKSVNRVYIVAENVEIESMPQKNDRQIEAVQNYKTTEIAPDDLPFY